MATKICSSAELPPGSMKGFTIGGREVLVANVDGNYYAMEGLCSHQGARLAAGKLQGEVVTCPRHGSQFNITSGEVVKNVPRAVKMFTRSEARDLPIFEVSVAGDDLFVEMVDGAMK